MKPDVVSRQKVTNVTRFEVVSKKLSNMKSTTYGWEIKDPIVLFFGSVRWYFWKITVFFWNHICNQNTEASMISKCFNIGWILKILVSLNQKFVLNSQKKTLKTKKVNNLVKWAVFSEKWWDFKNGFKGQKRPLAKWKPLSKLPR